MAKREVSVTKAWLRSWPIAAPLPEFRPTSSKPRAAKGRPRHYVFRYQPREKSFSLALQFKKSHADRDEIVRVLQAILADLTR